MKKYEEYKNSGVEWIGEIPEGWSLSKLKYVSFLNPSNKKPLVDDAEIGYMPMECLRYGRIEKRSAKLSELSTGLNYFEDGDLVMAKVTPCFENGNIAIAENLTNGCALGSSEVFVFRTKEIETKWLFYIMRHESLIKELASTMSGVGGLKRIDSEYMMNCSIPMPSLEEREGIISYLDSHCSKIDEMIEAKSKQIDDLKEYRKSLISEVVTKGLNPDVEMKESGVEWIGEVPEGWNLTRLKYVTLLNPSNKKPLDEEAEIGYMPMECLRYGCIEKRSAKLSALSTGLNYFEDGDLVMAKVTPCFENGNIAIAENLTNGCALGSSEVFVFRTKEIETKWLFYIMCHESLVNELASTMSGVGGLKRIDSDYMMNCIVPVPSQKERESIICYLDDKCTKIADLMKLLDDEIKELQKYKTSIISEAVTGKIKVC